MISMPFSLPFHHSLCFCSRLEQCFLRRFLPPWRRGRSFHASRSYIALSNLILSKLIWRWFVPEGKTQVELQGSLQRWIGISTGRLIHWKMNRMLRTNIRSSLRCYNKMACSIWHSQRVAEVGPEPHCMFHKYCLGAKYTAVVYFHGLR